MIRKSILIMLTVITTMILVACGYSISDSPEMNCEEVEDQGVHFSIYNDTTNNISTPVFDIDDSSTHSEGVCFTVTYVERIKNEKPEYVFELVGFKAIDSNVYFTDKITIMDAVSGDMIQEILLFDYYSYCYDESLGFAIEDMNFDGYGDMRIISFVPAGPNTPYLCWVWDNEAGQFVFDSALSGIPSLEVDHENELIRASIRDGGIHSMFYYKYIDTALTLVKRISPEVVDENGIIQYYWVTNELIDNQWITTETVKADIGGG